jgi:hypothetical protein
MKSRNTALTGLTKLDREVMASLLCLPPEEHKAALKPATPKGEGQRRRRQEEREQQSITKNAL